MIAVWDGTNYVAFRRCTEDSTWSSLGTIVALSGSGGGIAFGTEDWRRLVFIYSDPGTGAMTLLSSFDLGDSWGLEN